MLDAFGVSKKERKRVPDWALATMPASTAAAYNRAKTRKKEAAASNFAVKSGTAAAAAGTVAGSVFLLSRGKKLPKFFLRPSEVKVPKTNIKATVGPGEKQRTLASMVGGAAASSVGGYAGQKHLKTIKNNPRYGTEKVGKGLLSLSRGTRVSLVPKPKHKATYEKDFSTALNKTGMQAKDLAQKLGVSKTTVSFWTSGKMPIHPKHHAAIEHHIGWKHPSS